MKNVRLLLVFMVILVIKACDKSNSGINTKSVKDEINNRKIRRITEASIVEHSFEKGKMLLDTLKVLGSKNQVSGTSDTLTRLGSLQPAVDLLQQQYKAEIKKVILTDLSTGNSLKMEEQQIFEAYQYNIAQGLKVEDNVQLLEKHIFYAAPILENGELKGMWSIYFDKGELIKTID